MPPEDFHQRIQHPAGAADPVRHRRAVQVNALAGVDFALPVQGQMIGILGDKDVRQQARAN
jgi:hypothetical protein